VIKYGDRGPNLAVFFLRGGYPLPNKNKQREKISFILVLNRDCLKIVRWLMTKKDIGVFKKTFLGEELFNRELKLKGSGLDF